MQRSMNDVVVPDARSSIEPGSGTVTATVDLACSPERAYRMLVTAETERWWGSPDTYRMRDWSSELRPGGSWRVLVCPVDGGQLPAAGEFVEFDPPERIVQTRRYEFDHPTLGRRETLVTYALERRAGGSRLTVTHEGFRGLDAAAAEHAFGWARMMGWLQAYARDVHAQEGARS